MLCNSCYFDIERERCLLELIYLVDILLFCENSLDSGLWFFLYVLSPSDRKMIVLRLRQWTVDKTYYESDNMYPIFFTRFQRQHTIATNRIAIYFSLFYFINFFKQIYLHEYHLYMNTYTLTVSNFFFYIYQITRTQNSYFFSFFFVWLKCI